MNAVLKWIQDAAAVVMPGGGAALVTKIIAWTAAIALVLIPVVLLAIAWYRRRQARKSGQPVIRAGIGRRTLVKIWKQFLRQIPREFRRTILQYQPFVVFGTAGSGKTALISKYTDWRGQAAKFYSSYSMRNELQIYLGSRALVQEIPSGLMDDVSQAARTALIKLWRPLFKKREPMVVVALNAAALKGLTPDALRREAQVLRGKINIISRLRRQRVKTRIVITHMDKIDGYLAFSQFLDNNGIPLRLDLEAQGAKAELSQCLEPYEQYLPLALTTLSSKAYKKVLTFLTRAPSFLSLADIFRKTLQEKEPLSYEPEIRDVYLTSDTGTSTTGASNPLAATWDGASLAAEQESASRLHRRLPAAAAILAVGLLIAGYVGERQDWAEATTAVESFEKSMGPAQTAAVDEQLTSLTRARHPGVVGAVRPRFFKGAGSVLNERFINQIRDQYLLPGLERASASPTPAETTLYLLSAIYSTRDNRLGELVLENLDEISNVGDVPAHLMAAYVQHTREPWEGLAPLAEEPFEVSDEVLSDPQPWHAFFSELDEVFERRHLTASALEELQRGATRLRTELTRMEQNLLSRDVYNELARSAPVDLGRVFGRFVANLRPPQWLIEWRDPIAQMLELIELSDLPADGRATLTDMTFPRFIHHLRSRKRQTADIDIVHRFKLVDDPFAFSTKRWSEVLSTSSMQALVERYVASKRDKTAFAFFSQATDYPAVALNPTSSGEFLFTGKARVQGIYTRRAYEEQVRRQVLELVRLISPEQDAGATSPLDPSVRAELNTFIASKVEQYAEAYANAWTRFYESFKVKVTSRGGLLIVLRQMRLSDSQFNEFLQTVFENTALETTGADALRPLGDALEAFQFLNRLQATGEAGEVELQNYRAILNQIQTDLEGGGGEDGDGEDEEEEDEEGGAGGEPSEFMRSLTPLGRLAVRVLHNDRDSYVRLVEEWLDNVGIEGSWAEPFRTPVEQMYVLGREDLNGAIATYWNEQVRPEFARIASKFPFNRPSSTDLTPSKLEEVLHPLNGSFWERFEAMIGPVCKRKGHTWKPVIGPRGGLRMPAGMLDMVNHLMQVRKALWDSDGNPKALVLYVYPHPLPSGPSGDPAGTLSFIRTGEAIVFGFNQKRAWQRFQWEWWQGYPCQVAMQIGEPGMDDAGFRSLSVPETWWGLFKIIRAGQARLGNTYSWSLFEGGDRTDAPRVRFSFREDPWELFDVAKLLRRSSADASGAAGAGSSGGDEDEDEADEDEEDEEDAEDEEDEEEEEDEDDEDEDEDEDEDDEDEDEDEDEDDEDEDEDDEDEEEEVDEEEVEAEEFEED
jgi:hypothetical protein